MTVNRYVRILPYLARYWLHEEYDKPVTARRWKMRHTHFTPRRWFEATVYDDTGLCIKYVVEYPTGSAYDEFQHLLSNHGEGAVGEMLEWISDIHGQLRHGVRVVTRGYRG